MSFITAIYFIYKKIVHGINIEGWTSLLVVMLLMSGFQISMIGVIGEYLWRTLDELKHRKTFIIDEKVGFEE